MITVNSSIHAVPIRIWSAAGGPYAMGCACKAVPPWWLRASLFGGKNRDGICKSALAVDFEESMRQELDQCWKIHPCSIYPEEGN